MRALAPIDAGRLTTRGFGIGYEVFGTCSDRSLLLLPTWQISPSRHWNMQVPYLARSFRVITYDPPGIGSGERTDAPAAFELDRVVDYGVDLLDHLGVAHAGVVGLSMGGAYGLWMAARYPERVSQLFVIGTVLPEWAFADDPSFRARRDSYEGWEKRNAHYWREHYQDWLTFFMAQVFSEPHSTKAIEDAIAWASETTPHVLISSVVNPRLLPAMALGEVIERIRCPVLLMHARDDNIADMVTTRALAEARPDWELIEFDAGGHALHIRNAARVNLELGRFFGLPQPSRRLLRRAMAKHPPRILMVSSPVGLGHVQRDLAIACELRQLAPEIEIEWLAQHPVTRVLEAAEETIHPLSRELHSESGLCERLAGEHALHVFQAYREMQETFLANFMIFLEAVRDRPYDAWVGDEAWELDYHLHENPELKTAPFVFITDFVGFLPIDRSPASRESALTCDYNAEMIEQVARHPHVRDRAIYIGDYDDVLPERFGPGLPRIPEWVQQHFSAVGYVAPFDPTDYTDTRAVRERLGHDPDRALIVCAVGGTAVGEHLLHKAIAAWPLIHSQRPDARCLVVAGPRIDLERLAPQPGLELRGYVHNLHEHLAVADLAIVQGGLSTTMELTVSRRPFLYFPLANHCEQLYNVAYRLDAHHAGRRLEYATTDEDTLADAALATLQIDTAGYRHYEPGAAERAATLISELL
jgi:pimeloyl-ACP methyl ester carboxylesterase/UDP-N-acetylglucosamine:LPS N-acetylglucosamine transferase